jgi:hypothetical protein
MDHGGQARQTAIPPKRWRSRKIGGQEDSAFWFDFRLRSLTFGGQARQKVNHGGQAAHHRRMLRQSRSDAFGKRRRMEKNRKIMAGKPAIGGCKNRKTTVVRLRRTLPSPSAVPDMSKRQSGQGGGA